MSGFERGVLRFHRGLTSIENLLSFVAGMAIVAATVLGVLEIFGRSLFGMHVPGVIDLVEYLAAIFAFGALALCQRQGGHVGMDLVIGRLPRRGKHIAGLADSVIGLVFVGILTTATWSHFQRAFFLGDTSMDIQLPMWPAKLLIPLAFALWWLRLLIQAYGYLELLIRGGPDSDLIPPATHQVEAGDIDAAIDRTPV